MAYRSAGTALTFFALAVSGCFNPDPVSADTDFEQTGSSTGAMNTSEPDPTQPASSTSSTTSPTTLDETGTPTTDPDTTGTPPDCSGDEDCADLAGACEVAICSPRGTCEVRDAAEGTACGDGSETQCDGADTCDGRGGCVENVASDGVDCTDCDSGQCICSAGTCGECVAYADTNLFSTARSLNGWELTGDWGLYTEAPASVDSPPVPFNNSVLGTDGNRSGPAYPGGHLEFSYARTPPTELPTSLQFQSWHLDEGAGAFDNKIIRISTDEGATWTDLISCELDPLLPFCESISQRDPSDWDTISLPLPAPLIGQIGIIEFAYDTFDACCGFEKGWYIDVTNFATECACEADEVCEPYGAECAAAVCGANGACNVDPAPPGTACGDPEENVCTAADQCDGFGGCRPGDNYPPFDGGPTAAPVACDFCDAGSDCVGCAAGGCQDCASLPDLESFDSMQFPPFQTASFDWEFEAIAGGQWGVFFNIPANEDGDLTLFPSNAPFFGIDGSSAAPPNGMGEVNSASAVTTADVFGDTLAFRSWHQDEGGQGADTKTIELSVDEGATWIPIVDCGMPGTLSAFPFCISVNTRDAEDWDDISINISDYADMVGQLRFSYDTADSCCGFERGWFIDDLNFAQMCDAPVESAAGVPCSAWLEASLCNADQSCAWDGTASACLQCTLLTELECDEEPLCAWRVSENGSTNCAQAPQ